MLEKIRTAVAYIRTKTNIQPVAGIVLGTGLGKLADDIEIETSLPYEEIPNFPVSTVAGHKGRLVFGRLNGVSVVAMQGRFHYYEGYNMQDLTIPIRVMKELGIRVLVLSNASGGVNPDFEVGDIMIINDHINLMGSNPLIGPNQEELGPRFPDMSDAYDPSLIAQAEKIAEKNGIAYKKGVYAAVTGPCFETPAEYKYIYIIGADCVGMSTVPEVIVARHMNLPVFAVSIITDLGVPGKIVEISHEEVIKAANAAEPKMTKIISEMLTSV